MGSGAAQAEEAFRLVYAEAFAGPPYNETEGDVAANFRRFRSQTRKATFRAALARTEDGEPVGMAYGYPLGTNTGWWNRLTEPVPADMRREDGHRTFGLMELAVRAAWSSRDAAQPALSGPGGTSAPPGPARSGGYGSPCTCAATPLAKELPPDASQLVDQVIAPRRVGQVFEGLKEPHPVPWVRQSRALLTTDGET